MARTDRNRTSTVAPTPTSLQTPSYEPNPPPPPPQAPFYNVPTAPTAQSQSYPASPNHAETPAAQHQQQRQQQQQQLPPQPYLIQQPMYLPHYMGGHTCSNKGSCCYGCMAFFMGVSVLVGLGSIALLTFFSQTTLREYLEEQQWRYLTAGELMQANLTGAWMACRCDNNGGPECWSRFPCLEVIIKPAPKAPSLEPKTLYLNLRHHENAKFTPCFYSPQHSCHSSENVNEAIVKSYQADFIKEGVVSFYYYNPDDESQALWHGHYWTKEDIIMRMSPPASGLFVACIFFISSIAYFCKRS